MFYKNMFASFIFLILQYKFRPVRNKFWYDRVFLRKQHFKDKVFKTVKYQTMFSLLQAYLDQGNLLYLENNTARTDVVHFLLIAPLRVKRM